MRENKQDNILSTRRKQIIESARSWLGTPFHPSGCKRLIGCDCAGLVIGLAEQIGARSKCDNKLMVEHRLSDACYRDHYCDCSAEWHHMLNLLPLHLMELVSPALGSVALLQNPDNKCVHIGILGDYSENAFSLIHACMRRKMVIEHRLVVPTNIKIRYFDFWRV